MRDILVTSLAIENCDNDQSGNKSMETLSPHSVNEPEKSFVQMVPRSFFPQASALMEWNLKMWKKWQDFSWTTMKHFLLTNSTWDVET